MPKLHPFLPCAVLLLAAAPAAAQDPAAEPGPPPVAVHSPAWVGGLVDDRLRLAQLLSGAPTDGYLLRSPSADLVRLTAGTQGAALGLIAPEASVVYNSALPFSMNDGALWAGRGASTQLLAGGFLRLGPATLVVAPQLTHQQNREFDALPPGSARTPYLLPWYAAPRSADLPIRFGEDASTEVSAGQSSLSVEAGPLVAGASTEDQWWGPGIRNAIVLSNNAPGIPHLFLRTGPAVRTRLGSFEARWMVGELSESEYFDTVASNDSRSISALAATFRPAWEPNLTFGLARSVYAPVDGRGAALGRFADVLTRWTRRNDVDADTEERYNQVLSLFGRWVFPASGLEVYGEWARQDLPSTFAELMEQPGYSAGYTAGFQWARRAGDAGAVRLQSEVTYLEQTGRGYAIESYYTSAAVAQGYTHRGQVVGAAIGPGASSQWVAGDYVAPAWSLGAFGGRIRWDNDAYYSRITPWAFLGHDVSLYGGIRGSLNLPAFRVEAELATGERMNYLYQNPALSWEEAGERAEDVRNHTLRLVVSPLARPRGAPLLLPDAPPPPPAPPTPAAGTAVPDTALPAADTALARTPPAAAPARAAAPATHLVRAGETLFGIARRYGTTVAALQAANPQAASGAIRAGQTLRIPRGTVGAAPAAARRHRVQRGETLDGIARRYGVRPEAIRAANGLRDDRILADQELVIPAPR